MSDEPDDNLVARAAEGDGTAFAQLIERHSPALLALTRRLVPDAHDREDALQEGLLSAWLDLPSLRDTSRFKPWLLAVVRNRCRALHRRQGRRETPTDPAILETHMTRVGPAASSEELRMRVTTAVSAVHQPQLQAARMYYLDGQTIREIAAKLNKPKGTIKSQLFHARRAIRQAMGLHEKEKDG